MMELYAIYKCNERSFGTHNGQKKDHDEHKSSHAASEGGLYVPINQLP